MCDLKYIILDVDGTLTDGGIYYDDNGNEIKKFSAKDGTGIVCARCAGIKIVVLTGRECRATQRRMEELNVDFVFQKIGDKTKFLKNWMNSNDLKGDNVGYIGDDINDLAPMKLCSFIGCPLDACEEVKSIANYVSDIKGGYGAVRDVIEYYLKKIGLW